MQVCQGRWLFPERNQTQCLESDGTMPILFNVRQPCVWNNIETCQPIYFTIKINYKEVSPFKNNCTGKSAVNLVLLILLINLPLILFLSLPVSIESECQSLSQVGWNLNISGITCFSNNQFNNSLTSTLNWNLYSLVLVLINIIWYYFVNNF